MRVRAIDDNNDWTFGQGKQNYKSDELAIAQNVKTRIQCFLGDCFFDTESGIDWWNLLEKGTQLELLKSIKLTIIGTPGVTAINSFDYGLDRDRKLTVTYNIQTIFSQSYVDNLTIG